MILPNKKVKVLYGCCFKGVIDLEDIDVTYVDVIPGLRDDNYICSDIRKIKFSDYDIIVCSPPCNYWSIANYRRNRSSYSLHTRDLLAYCIKECIKSGKPYIIENVRNYNLMEKEGIFNLGSLYITYGRHTYFVSKLFFPNCVQKMEFVAKKWKSKRQGGNNVNEVFKEFILSCL